MLIKYNWDSNKLLNKIDDLQAVRTDAGVDLKTNLKPFFCETCPICYETLGGESEVTAEECGHKMCRLCWVDYLENKINTEPLEMLKARCPAHPDCNMGVSHTMWAQILKPDL
mmetsp:Transcript_74842/g.161879  ORF Transcript_74842/g.161879 Transcript_74842/m.161879 type:complete len:113 (+) Transcript_74842:195-533(+)